jgi:nucleotide-binding universal stress UspA family protein
METILVPTDFSPAANNATDYAVELAKYFEAKLVLVHAYSIPTSNPDTMFPIDSIKTWENLSFKKMEELKSQLLLKNKENLEIECLVEMGSAYDIINLNGIKYNADLIVMGIVGEAGRIKAHLIGSLAVRVARHLEIPTFIIPEQAKYHPIRHLSFACDMAETEKTGLVDIVKSFSKIFDADVEVVNVESPEEEVSFEKARTSVFIEKKLENVKHKTIFVTEKSTAKGLENYFESHPTDVVILNPKKHNIFHVLFKENVTNELAFHVHLPILAIH